jgi:hypothetical protein
VPASNKPYEPIAGETYPNAKRLAGRFVQALTTYTADEQPADVLRAAVKGKKDDELDLDRVLRRAAPLFRRNAVSRSAIVYPQLGGLTLGSGADRSSVMVVVRQTLQDSDGKERTITRTVDVRLINRDDEWRLEDLADAGGQPVEADADVPELARRVLTDTRIELPDSARWDILRGGIDQRILKVMIDLAGVAPFAVAVLKSGHPYNVFGTDVVSGHSLGRGMDIWRVGGEPVVLQHRGRKSDARVFTTAALKDFDVPELGSPWDLDGPPVDGEPRPSFTDAVHADHIHVAFKAA